MQFASNKQNIFNFFTIFVAFAFFTFQIVKEGGFVSVSVFLLSQFLYFEQSVE